MAGSIKAAKNEFSGVFVEQRKYGEIAGYHLADLFR